jgi:iron-sulfur cluster assembly protein
MLSLTERASTIIRSITEQPDVPDTAGLRIAAGPDGDQALSATAVAAPAPGDQVIEQDGARVFLDAEASARLDDQVLDAQLAPDDQVQFTLATRHVE